MATGNFFEHDQARWEHLEGGLSRTVIGHTPELMTMLVRFPKGGIGQVHSHEAHTQISYVAAGSFKATVDGETRVLKVGDAFIAPRFAAHGVEALEEGSLLVDAFSPRRDDIVSEKR